MAAQVDSADGKTVIMTPVKEDIKVTHSISQRRRSDGDDDDIVSKLLKRYCSFLVRYPWIPLCIMFIVVGLSAVLGILESTGAPPLPDFSDPTKGFEPRGTTIASRRKALLNLERAVGRTLFRKNVSGSYLNRKKRNIGSSIIDLSGYTDGCLLLYGHSDSTSNLFDYMTTICKLHKQLIIDSPGYNSSIVASYHIPAYIALLNDKSCEYIDKNDTDNFIDLLKSCVSFYKSGDLKACMDSGKCGGITVDECRLHPVIAESVMTSILYNTFHNLVPSSFVDDMTQLKLTTSIDIIWDYDVINSEIFKPLYDDKLKDLDNAKLDGVEVKGFQFFNFKLHLFQTEIILQSLLIISALVLVVIFIWFYCGSLFIGLTTFFGILATLIIAHFVYGRVFQMEFFPFLNMVTLIFIVGIGADDAFVFMGIWAEAKKLQVIRKVHEHEEYLIKWTTYSLKHAALAMLVTSMTTSAAFYANISSPVTSVKCFGLYAGTAIIINYLLMLTIFPVCVIIHDKYLANCMHALCPGICKMRPEVAIDGRDSFEITCSNGGDLNANNIPGKQTPVEECQTVLTVASDKIFRVYLPFIVLKLKYIWLVLLMAMGIAGAVITFAKPGLKRPSTSEFQMFTDSSSLEQFNLNYKSKFAFGKSGSGFNQFANITFGVKATDNGNKFDPDDHGALELNSGALDIATVQVWLDNFCINLKHADFYRSSFTCSAIEEMFSKLQEQCVPGQTKCCNRTLPLPSEEFMECFNQALGYFSTSYSFYGPLFDSQSNLRTLSIDVSTTYEYSDEYQYNDDLFTKFDNWFNTQLSNVTSDTFNGWWSLEQSFYDLQKSLFEGTKLSLGIAIAVSFVIILLTTWNLLLSVYSILTITFIISVTVAILVLRGWELNIMESVIFSVAAGLSADFTLHYSVAYKTSIIQNSRVERVKSSLKHIGPAILMGAFTTFIAGLVMVPSTILAYIQMAQFLMLVMFISWVYSTLFFLPLCSVIGPVGTMCQLTFKKMRTARASLHRRDHIEMESAQCSNVASGVYYGPTE